MQSFFKHFAAFLLGFLCGYDRIRFRGSKRQLCYPNGIMSFLQIRNIRYADFKTYVKDTTNTLRNAIEEPARQAGIYRYLNSNRVSPEEVALQIAAEQKITSGLIAVLGRVEPGQVVEWHMKKSGWWAPRLKNGAKCMHYYHYYLDPDFGLRSTRLQSWFPFVTQIGMNGRRWLACQMRKAGIDFVQKENCFTWIHDFSKAQQLLNQQMSTDWPTLLDKWIAQSNPVEDSLLERPIPYYWTIQEAEYATDLVFRSREDLQRFYPLCVHQAYTTLQSGDLLRFMNYRVCKDGTPHPQHPGEVKTTIKEIMEGTCVRHRIHGNLLKMYDKMGSVLRVESMLHDIHHFRTFRNSEIAGEPPRYMRMRKGVADMHRRAEISEKINDRYIQTLATVEEKTTLGQVTKDLCRSVRWKGRSARALNPLAEEDLQLLSAVNRGVFMIQGFRNHDIRAILYPKPSADVDEEKRRSLRVTRLFRLLRAHSLIAKVPKTHRYQVSEKGRASICALLAAREANTQQLLQAA